MPFLVTKGSRGLEKKVNETHLLKTVFGYLNTALDLATKIEPTAKSKATFRKNKHAI